MKDSFIHETIDRVRRKLNARILLGVIFQHAPKVSVASGVIVFLWRFFCSFGFLPGASLFSGGYAIPVFFALNILAFPVIAGFNRKRLITRREAAMWLDERLDAKGIFGAALECLSGGCTSVFSGQILADAMHACKSLLPSLKKLFPRRVLIRSGLIALFVLICMPILISVWNPRAAELDRVASAGENAVSSGQREREQEKGKAQKPEEKMSDADFARNLFPEDKRLASLAEEALKNGDQSALDYLMKENGLKAEDLKSQTARDEMAQKADSQNNQQDSAQGASESKKDAGQNSNPDQGKQNKNNNQNGTKQAPEGKDNNTKSDPKGTQTGGKENTTTAAGEGKENSENNNAGKTGQTGKGDAAGTGTGADTAGLASKTRISGSEKVIKFRKEGTPLEFVLPDKEAKGTMLEALPSALRGSEAGSGKDNAPLDYESFVKFYFSTLSKEMQQ